MDDNFCLKRTTTESDFAPDCIVFCPKFSSSHDAVESLLEQREK